MHVATLKSQIRNIKILWACGGERPQLTSSAVEAGAGDEAPAAVILLPPSANERRIMQITDWRGRVGQ